MHTNRNLVFSLLWASMAYLPSAQANDNLAITPYIINGNAVSTSSYPYMALLIHNELEQPKPQITSFCGGTLLSEQYVLTAAHCLYTQKPSDYENLAVVFNVDQIKNDAFDTNNMYAADWVYYPDEYTNSDNFTYDIAIIKLATPVSQNVVSSNGFVQLTSSENYQAEGNTFKVLGYGKTGPDESGSNTLQATQVEYAAPELCSQAFSGTPINDQQICVKGEVANNLQTGVCGGDSGGPLLYDDKGTLYQVGIVSFGPESCGSTEINVQSVFTKVSAYGGWIASVLSGTESPKYEITQMDNDAQGDGESSSSGGSLGFIALILLGALGLLRRNNSATGSNRF